MDLYKEFATRPRRVGKIPELAMPFGAPRGATAAFGRRREIPGVKSNIRQRKSRVLGDLAIICLAPALCAFTAAITCLVMDNPPAVVPEPPAYHAIDDFERVQVEACAIRACPANTIHNRELITRHLRTVQ